ncbi:uncharacterized protein LY89DRAFT_415448 [Mollisia scopiformis]|uniref:Uncharacterized protein n=1 Tax=Mollisia scopiformis TaxID=149040 RepID=A0A132B2D6_MOLSC|nr:uncharacterized protein LY89DRAFT_415448 [Mollisia scopiformis]KUJ06199.1 hypothetical protein LY89DRAFT_415448 [Mollisia scopiformis]
MESRTQIASITPSTSALSLKSLFYLVFVIEMRKGKSARGPSSLAKRALASSLTIVLVGCGNRLSPRCQEGYSTTISVRDKRMWSAWPDKLKKVKLLASLDSSISQDSTPLLKCSRG